jgi:general secretion pathway protein E
MSVISAVPPLPIGQLLYIAGLITELDLERALQLQAQLSARLGEVLLRLGLLSEDNFYPILAKQLDMALLDEAKYDTGLAKDFATKNKIDLAKLHQAKVLIWEQSEQLFIASPDPIYAYTQEWLLHICCDQPINWLLIKSSIFDRLSTMVSDESKNNFVGDELSYLRELAQEAPVIELVNNIWAQAIDAGASDIHIEPEEKHFSIRFRVDGILKSQMKLPKERYDAVATRIKLISGLDIAERRLPQDGRISVKASGIEIDIRVSSVPAVHGESIVLRLLPKEKQDFSLARLGMEADHMQIFRKWVGEPHGIVLVTGPTGSGKSTTLYTALSEANDHQHKMITVEDPVEYRLQEITQIQAHAEIGYTFARALRAILRHDPDIIMIGEIRDLETAEIAIQSAMTGHMVLSTLHTNDAISAFGRLMDMGIEPFLISSSVRAVQAQRLLRKLCTQCAIAEEDSVIQSLLASGLAETMADLRYRYPLLLNTNFNWLKPVGCAHCQYSGYKGRQGIYEFLEVSPDIQAGIIRKASSAEFKAIAIKEGYRTLREDGLIKASKGISSIEEVSRVCGLHNGVHV